MAYDLSKLKILIVDDNPFMRKLLAELFTSFRSKEVVGAASAEEAWDMLSVRSFDILVVDWELDGMSGLDLSKRIRTDAKSLNPFVPIIMVTAHANLERVQAARDAGVTEFLTKPVSIGALVSRLTSIIERPRPFVRTSVYYGPDRRRFRDEDKRYTGPSRRSDDTKSINLDAVKEPAVRKTK